MSVLTFSIPAMGKVGEHSVIIDNWRYMTRISYNYGNTSWTDGTRIILQNGMIDVMGYVPPMIHEIIYHDMIAENVIFTTSQRDHPSYCFDCGGAGQVDWVSNAMKRTQSRLGSTARLFEREEESVLFYNKGNSITFHKIFSRCKVMEGFKLCRRCSGTGLNLDARQRIFSGMPGLKYNLKEFAWDGLILPN